MATTGFSRIKSSIHQDQWANAGALTRQEAHTPEPNLNWIQQMTTSQLVLILLIEVVRFAQDVLMLISA